MNTKVIGLWSFLIGLVLTMANEFVSFGDWVTQVLIVLGILTGIFHHFRDDLLTLGVIYLALVATAGAFRDLVAVGPILTDIVAAWVKFLGPVVLTAALMWGTPRLMTNKKR